MSTRLHPEDPDLRVRFYRMYRNFFDRAERKRRWSVAEDVPWDQVNRSLPAVTTSLWLLATPLLGIVCATLILNEPLEPSLFLAMSLIIGGIALGAAAPLRAKA